MDLQLIQKLNTLTSEFYRHVAASFSSTRRNPWQGWEQLKPLIEELSLRHSPLVIADFACGNLRFEDFLVRSLAAREYSVLHPVSSCVQDLGVGTSDTQHQIICHGFDNCPKLMHEAALELRESDTLDFSLTLHECDLMSAIRSWDGKTPALAEPVQLAVTFGFMHHVPSFKLRERALQYFGSNLEVGGTLCVSLWQFLRSPQLERKARRAFDYACASGIVTKDELACLEPGDMLLGWQESMEQLRYCHHFDNSEIEALVAALEDMFELKDSFVADGKSNNLNTYLVFKKKHA